jgi:hypothetical protein
MRKFAIILAAVAIAGCVGPNKHYFMGQPSPSPPLVWSSPPPAQKVKVIEFDGAWLQDGKVKVELDGVTQVILFVDSKHHRITARNLK